MSTDLQSSGPSQSSEEILPDISATIVDGSDMLVTSGDGDFLQRIAENTLEREMQNRGLHFKAFLASAGKSWDVVSKAINFIRVNRITDHRPVQSLEEEFRKIYSHMLSTHGELPSA